MCANVVMDNSNNNSEEREWPLASAAYSTPCKTEKAKTNIEGEHSEETEGRESDWD